MIGILGIYYNVRNFGAQLQAAALQSAVSNCGMECVWIRYDYRKGIENPFVDANIKSEFEGDDGDFWRKYARNVEMEIQKRNRAFDEFQGMIPHTDNVYDIDTLPEVLSECSGIMVGGDQVWNSFYYNEHPNGIENFTLTFVPDNMKKFSFSSSTGGGLLSKSFQQRLGMGLKRFDLISVREKSSIPMVESLSGKSVTSVLDSAFLLTHKEWNRVRRYAASIEKCDNKFAVCFFMGRYSEWRESSERICRMTGVDVLTFPHLGESRYYKADYKFGDIRDFTSGPAEFLDLIARSEFVVTDSYHACVFSIIYNKPFYVFLRDETTRDLKTNERITDMLNEFGLFDRIVTPNQLLIKDKIKPIDYEKVNGIVESRRKVSLDFLEEALKLEKQ